MRAMTDLQDTPSDIAAVSPDEARLTRMANAIRALAMDAVEKAQSGHPGMPMGMADVATVLFSQFLKYDPAAPDWPDRDRFVLSAGHGSMLQYALLYLTGYDGITLDDIKHFRQLDAKTAGHPEYGVCPGVETTTGPLGQGLATAVGMAMAEKILAAHHGSDLVDHKTYVIASDGDLMEGISHEAISLAGHLKLNKLIVLFDDNGISIDGPVSLSESGDQVARFEAAGWSAMRVDGHDTSAVAAALEQAQESDAPVLIACKTTIGYGAPTKAGKASSHGAALGADEIVGAREALGWPHGPFEIPDDILSDWRQVGARGAADRKAWEERLAATGAQERSAFTARLSGELDPDVLSKTVNEIKRGFSEAQPKKATRALSGECLDSLTAVFPQMIGGSADLSGSNNTKAKTQGVITAEDFSGGYIHYGVREHGMAAAMNGMALHGGVIPYSGTFLVFSDYCRPAIRLAALMKQRVIHVMTHDSIGLGEDGPTHQPVEHLASLRAMPNVQVLRPADAVETAEIWELALRRTDGPSVMALTRQGVPTLRTAHTDENLSARGAYELRGAPEGKTAEVTLYATGSEVEIAVAARDLLAKDGIGARVVSVPCFELFEAQDETYIDEVRQPKTLQVAVEAAVRFGWERIIGRDGLFVGMRSFGESAPANALYEHFGITPENVAQTVAAALNKAKAL